MKPVRTSGTENYAEEAPELLKRYESVSFADHHRSVIHLIPTVPGRVLDIGAGTGRVADTKWLAARHKRKAEQYWLSAPWAALQKN
jgi:ubiquinone/menaquinone biosynthesis C-methylase UbiE